MFLFKINHRRAPCKGCVTAVTHGLLLIRCSNSTRALVLVSLNDLHECARKPRSSEFSRGKNPCQTPLQPNSREDTAGSLVARAWTQTAKCFQPKSSCMSPTSCCFLQPASLTAQLEVGNCPIVYQLMAKMNPCYTAFPWEFGIPLSTQCHSEGLQHLSIPSQSGQDTTLLNCRCCALYLPHPKRTTAER